MEKPINMVDFASRVCLGPGSVTEAEHRALKDITKPASRYKRVVVGDEVYPGTDVVSVFGPDQESPAWMIVFKDGTKIHTTHPVTVVENAQ